MKWAEYIGKAIMVLALCYGCSHCDRERVELQILREKASKELKDQSK